MKFIVKLNTKVFLYKSLNRLDLFNVLVASLTNKKFLKKLILPTNYQQQMFVSQLFVILVIFPLIILIMWEMN